MTANDTIVFTDEGSVDVVERPVPEPDSDEVLIETERSLVSSGTERALLADTHQPDNVSAEFPRTPGYSNVGTVIDTGSDVDDSYLGARVGSGTVHARYVTTAADDCTRVPDGVDSSEATFFNLAAVAMNAVRRGELAWGEAVAVRGLGLVGQLAVRTALIAGATPIYAIDLDRERVAMAPDHDRVEPIHPGADGEAGPPENIAPIVVDATGNPETLGEGVSLMQEDGRFVVVGCPRRTVEFDVYRRCIVPSAHIIGAYRIPPGGEGRWDRQAYHNLFFDYVSSGELVVDSMVTAEPTVDEAPAVYESVLEDPTSELGVVFDWR